MPMNPMVLLAALAVLALFLSPAHTWLALGGDLREYFQYETLPGQVPYVLSKLCALYAVEFVWLQALLGLLRPRLVQPGRMPAALWRRAHTALGLAALLTMLAHVLLFVVATSLRNRNPALDLLLPWGHGVYRTWVAFGAASLWLLVIAAAVQLGRWLSARLRLWVHRIALVAVVLVAVHSLAIGSESR